MQKQLAEARANGESLCAKRPHPILEVPPTFGVHAPFWRSPVCSYTYLVKSAKHIFK